MEKLIAGEKLSKKEDFTGKCTFCDFSVLVKKGHEECGDSAFIYYDKLRRSIKAVYFVMDTLNTGKSNVIVKPFLAKACAIKTVISFWVLFS